MRDSLQEFVGGNENQFVSGKFRQATMAELLKAREHLDSEASSHSIRLKKFVKDNFESCIRSKDTISEVPLGAMFSLTNSSFLIPEVTFDKFRIE